MGIGTGTRRAANRSNAKSKSVFMYLKLSASFGLTVYFRVSSDVGRSESPYVGSENGTMSDHASPSPAKSKGKSKKRAGKQLGFCVVPPSTCRLAMQMMQNST